MVKGHNKSIEKNFVRQKFDIKGIVHPKLKILSKFNKGLPFFSWTQSFFNKTILYAHIGNHWNLMAAMTSNIKHGVVSWAGLKSSPRLT